MDKDSITINRDFESKLKTKTQMGGCGSNKKEIFQYAWDNNIRLFDSGWGYSGIGVNDTFIGEFIQDKNRDEIVICNKLPLFNDLYKQEFGGNINELSKEELEKAIDVIIKEQLKRNNTNYFDIYMLHALYDDKYGENRLGKIDLYKRIVSILVKYYEKGIIKRLGFSAHIDFEKLYYFTNEMKREFGDLLDVAEVAYNVLNNNGKSYIANRYDVMVWDAVGDDGLKLLKDLNYKIINMMPNESGRLELLSTAPDFINWNYRFIYNNKYIDYVLAGTSSIRHFNMLLDIENKKYLKDIPDMRKIEGLGSGHCGE